MDEFIKQLYGKNIHVIGVTGSEGSNILRFLVKNKIDNIKAHDLLLEGSVEKSFKIWHKGLTTKERNESFQQFQMDVANLKLYTGRNYLQDIDKADFIFVPQSWRLYKENAPLVTLKKEEKIKFYSLMRLYLDYAKAKVVGVTGTVGKGSVANLLLEILKASLSANRQAYFAGNETWRKQLLDQLDIMQEKDILILEISHRQLLDGFSRPPSILVFTNFYPNHLDEMSFEDYKKLKFSLLFTQSDRDICILNHDDQYLREAADKLLSKVYFFSAKNRNTNIKNVQKIYDHFLNNKTHHYFTNIMAASTAGIILGIQDTRIISTIAKVPPLTARLNLITEVSGVKFYDDIKSTTPWATLAAVDKLGENTVLICGGRTKCIDYGSFFPKIKKKILKIIFLDSELASVAQKYLGSQEFPACSTLEEALSIGFTLSKPGDNVLVSPAAGFFYSDFIKDKKTLSKIITSLPPKEQV